ncbi:hypothetical protein AJ79_07736 [Helicocarpus griseus UAMH5409]|uniref:Histone-lysine N-methyltransferase SET5 n=1 Tax=Helicocarpus griseus UAMH5409 TaxID=1447875 RepID=A0A2B7WZQ1_9EURO|nr:hypothetical protein AJ79_07736 [Helicocarpus griseus UAMH5409]
MAASGETVFNTLPPEGTVRPAYFPPRPDLFDEVDWGNFPTQQEAEKAYRLWSVQDHCLGDENNRLRSSQATETETDDVRATQNCLARNVYENILQSHLFPLRPTEWRANAQYRHIPGTDTYEPLSYGDIFGPDDPHGNGTVKPPSPPVLVNGHNVLTDKFWTKVRLQAQLRSRRLDPVGLVANLRRRLYDYELAKREKQTYQDGLLPREDLSEWGISRKNDYMIKISSQGVLQPLDIYTWAIMLSPYNPAYWTSRAFLHYQMGHFDLALGDAYRAQLLCEVLVNPHARNRQPGLYARIWDAVEKHILQISRINGKLAPEVQLLRNSNGVNYFIPTVRKAIHHIISLSLLGLRCWSDYEAMEKHLTTRLVMPDRDATAIMERWDGLKAFVATKKANKERQSDEYFFETNCGRVLMQDYPYSAKDVNRAAQKFKRKITEDFIGRSQLFNPNAMITVDKDIDGDLSVYASRDIEKGDIIYIDEPSIRGHLQDSRRDEHMQQHCENCKREIPQGLLGLTKQTWTTVPRDLTRAVCDCFNLSEPFYWCYPPSEEEEFGLGVGEAGPSGRVTRSRTAALHSRGESRGIGSGAGPSKKRKRKEAASLESEILERPAKKLHSCLEIGRSLYHFRACGKDWKWLHDSMRPNYSTRGNGPLEHNQYLACTHESHGTQLSLLLREVFDVTLHRRKVDNRPNLLAHEIDELLPLFEGEDGHLFPFSFSANIKVPFDILMCLGVNIFRDLTFDTWVIQTVLRKLLPNVIPWDMDRRGNADTPETAVVKSQRRDMSGTPCLNRPKKLDPTFKNLYLFPGMSFFNHSCLGSGNALWDWDSVIPNRIIVYASTDIRAGDEVRLQYHNHYMGTRSAYRLFQSNCTCARCADEFPSGNNSSGFYHNSNDYGSSSSKDSPSLQPSPNRDPSNGSGTRDNGQPSGSPGHKAAGKSASNDGDNNNDAADRPENPRRRISADENYDEETASSDSTEVLDEPLRMDGDQRRPRVKWAGKEVTAETYRRYERERERKQRLQQSRTRD